MTAARTTISDIYDLVKSPDGRVRLVANEKKRQAKLPVCARGKSTKVKYGKKAASSVNRPI